MREQSSALDGAIRALVSEIRAALPNTQVLDGPSTDQPERDTVVVGFGETAAVVDRSEPDYGGRVTEVGDIVCVISCWDGETDISAKRGRVFGYLAEIEARLRDNPQLVTEDFPDGAVDACGIGGAGQLSQTQQKGAQAALGFSVTYEAHI
jgi:hypothetical protein